MERQATLVIIKPDAIRHGVMGEAISRLEELRLEMIGAKMVEVSQELAEEHYRHIREKPFFRETVDHLRGKLHDVPFVLAFVLWGSNAIERVREVTGATNPEKAEPTTIRGALGRMTTGGLMENVLHASSDPADAGREIRLWFTPEELLRDVGAWAPAPRTAKSPR